MAKKYYSKVLLFGEYTVTQGSGALAMPYSGHWGCWDFDFGNTSEQKGLQILFEHLSMSVKLKSLYNLRKFKEDLESGLIFRSNIPQGYGLGSSGALVAGTYDRYGAHKTEDIVILKHVLAETESAFHGSSSGVDPLVSYLNIPVLINAGGQIKEVSFEINKHKIYLIDTGIARKTDLFIEIFKNKLNTDTLFQNAIKNLSRINQKAINAVIANDSLGLFSAFGQISSIQFEYFKEMIPECLLASWQSGLDLGECFLKLCGAGGGGMMLCMAKPSKDLPDEIKTFPLLEL